jgi:threonine dehydrogenase-like Zn-dependent dehydrogenase
MKSKANTLAIESTMPALVFRGKQHIALENVPLPTLEAPTDAIVRISICGLCGSDMHPYHCREHVDVGTICGHEFVGCVHETGTAVMHFKVGDRVMSPFTVSCGDCCFCKRGLTARCVKSQLLGWKGNGNGLHGAQTRFIRIPLADSTLVRIPSGITDEQALLLGDVFSTGYFAADNSDLATRYCRDVGIAATVAIVGCGPVGLIAILAARHLGASKILAVDSVPERLSMAQRFGATAVDRSQCDPVDWVLGETDGYGVDVVIEAVGLPSAFELACSITRAGGTISVAGCHTEASMPLSKLYDKNLTLKSGRCPARAYMERLLPLVKALHADPAEIITHCVALSPDAYRMFDARRDGCIKVIMDPWL